MLIFKDTKSNLLQSSSIALGFFDGIHLGHVAVIKTMLNKARQNNLPSCVVTFANHPLEFLQKKKIVYIIPFEKRLELLQKMGVDAVLVLKFTPEFIAMSAESYLRDILIKSLHPQFITVGFNHFFGANKKGNGEFLHQNAEKYGYTALSVPPVNIADLVVSSTAIKKFIEEGDIKNANILLGRDFSIEGEVVSGKELGRTIGFATANLIPNPNLINIPNGVYAGYGIVQGKKYKAMINIGTAPTLKGGEKTIESHFLGFNKDIYGQNIEVGFLQKIRDEKKFGSKEELVAQLKQDAEKIKSI